MLQKPTENPHATMITLFMNAVFETHLTEEKYNPDHVITKLRRAITNKSALEYIGRDALQGWKHGPARTLLDYAKTCTRDGDAYFDE
jgi:hypothetical protein